MIDPRTLPDPLPIEPLASPPDVDVVLPGSKSISNRALVCAALAEGQSVLRGALFADDTRAMLGVLDGHRESEASWTELIEQLRSQGLQLAPKLAIGDGALDG